MLNFFSRRAGLAAGHPKTADARFEVESLEPRIVLDATTGNGLHPIVEVQTNFGNIYIELFEDDTPATVANFMGYVERDDWDNTFFHRLMTGFVLQGGGWSYDKDRTPRTDKVTQQNPVENEFGISNTQWTVAMAKLGGDPDSATSEWFINLADNSENLDNQNGGFTVFGEVVGGRDVVNTITDLRVINLGSGFETVPVSDNFDETGNTLLNDDLVVIRDVVLVFDPDTSLLADTTVVPGGTANFANLTTVTLQSQFGRAIAFQQNGPAGGWTVTDLNLNAEQSGTSTAPVTWIDPKDSTTYAAGISTDGLMLYKNTTGTTWTVRNLNTEIAGAGLITSSLTTFISKDDRVYVIGLTASGEMMLFRQTGGESNGEFTWTARNLSTTDLTVNNLDTTPVFTSPLSSYVTAWNGLNIVGLDANGDIQAVWWAPGRDAWSAANLSNSTGAPPMQGTIAPYLISGRKVINLAGTDLAGNVVVTWWVPSFGGDWVQSNLTDLKGGPTLDAGSVATYVTSSGGTSILGRNAEGDVVVYWWEPPLGPGNWLITNMNKLITGAEIPTGPMIGVTSPSGVINIFGSAADGELIRYWWRNGDPWQWENVSSTASFA